MEDSHYDEFGNYIGPALSDSDQVRQGSLAAAAGSAAVLRSDASYSKR
jgi:hypothetical protein